MIPMFGSRRRPVMQRPQNRPAPQARPVNVNHNLIMTSRAQKQAPAKKESKPETAVLEDLGSFEKLVKFLS